MFRPVVIYWSCLIFQSGLCSRCSLAPWQKLVRWLPPVKFTSTSQTTLRFDFLIKRSSPGCFPVTLAVGKSLKTFSWHCHFAGGAVWAEPSHCPAEPGCSARGQADFLCLRSDPTNHFWHRALPQRADALEVQWRWVRTTACDIVPICSWRRWLCNSRLSNVRDKPGYFKTFLNKVKERNVLQSLTTLDLNSRRRLLSNIVLLC